MKTQFSSVLAVTALCVCAWAGGAAAQNGSNLHIFSNGMDVIYGGVGAGGPTAHGRDGLGVHINGEDLRGNTMTVLGDFGYRQRGFRESLCVLGPPSPSLALDFPLLITLELDGIGVFDPQAIFSFPRCLPSAPFPLGNSAGFAPYGGPSAGSFAIATLPSGVGVPSTTAFLVPNHGLVGGPTSATATIIAAAITSLPIASTGFCWVVQFGWSPSSLASLDDIDGWYSWRTNSRGGIHGNQYWGMSNDELGTWQSQTIATTHGLNSVTQFFANVSYDYVITSANPVTQEALLPASSNGTGTYSAVGAGVPNSGSSINGGFDVGTHLGMSLSGTGGVPNPNTGLANQDPLGSPTAGLVPTLGFLTSNNDNPGPNLRHRVTWVSIYNELSFGVDPALTSDATVAFGAARAPNLISNFGGPFPQQVTVLFLPTFLHSMDTTSGALWPDPSGLLSGTFVTSVQGASAHLPLSGASGLCLGIPIGLQYGSSALGSATGPLVWSRNGPNAPSNSGVLPLID